MDLDRAKAVADVAQTIINSAKVEVDLLRVTGGSSDSSLFSPKSLPAPKGPGTPAPRAALPHGESR